mmetsp:Transcript_117689/g.329550  ORF Transcript_117689/g.329550 Transcript_117689/m.329550 type:complete len:214 (-) Transcript_117689:77-718(-)
MHHPGETSHPGRTRSRSASAAKESRLLPDFRMLLCHQPSAPCRLRPSSSSSSSSRTRDRTGKGVSEIQPQAWKANEERPRPIAPQSSSNSSSSRRTRSASASGCRRKCEPRSSRHSWRTSSSRRSASSSSASSNSESSCCSSSSNGPRSSGRPARWPCIRRCCGNSMSSSKPRRVALRRHRRFPLRSRRTPFKWPKQQDSQRQQGTPVRRSGS